MANCWGRTTDVPWGVVFPGAGMVPRHPSELYEAGTEEDFAAVHRSSSVLVRFTNYPRTAGHCSQASSSSVMPARASSASSLREPDSFLGFLWFGATMGQLLSIPVLLLGLYLVWRAKPAT